MKDLPSSFKVPPGQDPHSYFKNLCIEFKKLLKESKDTDLLQNEMVKLINASKDLQWNEDHKKPLKWEAGEKAISKVWDEFKIYINQLSSEKEDYNYQDLLDAIEEIQRMIDNFDVR